MNKIGIYAGLVLAGIVVLFTGIRMRDKTETAVSLEKFDDLWGALGYPEAVEQKMTELLPQAEALEDKSIYLQMLSQIALAQALQRKFDVAHKTLDNAEALLTPQYALARARILLERGRTYQQAGNIPDALKYFEQSYEESKKHNLDAPTINAAHMIAIVVDNVEDKIKWNKLALDLVETTKDTEAKKWIGPVTNNLGQNYLTSKQYDKALPVFQKALELFQKDGYAPSIRIAKWTIAHTLRMLGRTDEALDMLQALLKDYDAISASGNFDCPQEIFLVTRACVYEDMAEIYSEKAREFAALAYDALSKDEMFRNTEPKRLELLQQIQQANSRV